jgi:hypothetical protein
MRSPETGTSKSPFAATATGPVIVCVPRTTSAQFKRHADTHGARHQPVPPAYRKLIDSLGFKRPRLGSQRSVAADDGLMRSGSSAGSNWGANRRTELS